MVAEINPDRAMLINSIVELGAPRRAKQSGAPAGDGHLLLGDVRSRASRETPMLADHRFRGPASSHRATADGRETEVCRPPRVVAPVAKQQTRGRVGSASTALLLSGCLPV